MDDRWNLLQNQPFSRLNARERAYAICNPESFTELLGPRLKLTSPHLPPMGQTPQFDDGVVVGLGTVGKAPAVVVSQESKFLGGGVGEAHGTKMVMAIRLALRGQEILESRSKSSESRGRVAVVISFDTGGVRLQEANAGLLAHSEVMDAFQAARGKVPIIGIVGGTVGCFGGMGFVAASVDVLIMSDVGRLGLTGPGVIEEVVGTEEFDAANRALVWRTTGGRHRFITRDADFIVEDTMKAFREKVAEVASWPIEKIASKRIIGTGEMVLEQMRLVDLAANDRIQDSWDLWRQFGNEDIEYLWDSNVSEFEANARRWPRGRVGDND
ncbi:MAG: biotin-independent malonate decarboxylase subunit beta [Bacillota bacterium]|jgi:biotin-independent malonate decarboxylase beta subunit|nr:biotin-independent malonate decarboxylase subunit beta [Bacillota bacterium]MDI9415686.1 biotin-independent malonate decarboxylase subunit beta [Bacillota bacterium]NLD12021.1 biotin-independent malonate decarboxylase subunit beta [Bacillota bacterium]HOB87986.1 biotin-independent malonate decarboxylase subunit beta [Bacillota bacterium]HOJ56996.1 biotin-independent malonate decarboxylase subunit beta [Bacillota bacterium]